MYADKIAASRVNTSRLDRHSPIAPDAEPSSPGARRKLHRSAKKERASILILGPVGAGKSLLVNLVAEEKVRVASPGMGPCTTECRYAKQVIADQPFRLIDSPGFTTNSRSNFNVFKHLIEYLVKIRASSDAWLTRVLYLHPDDGNLECDQLRHNLVVIQQLFGEAWLPYITVGVVGSDISSHSNAVHALQDTASPFYLLHKGGAKIQQLVLQTRPIEEFLLNSAVAPPEEPSFYSQVMVNWHGRYPRVERDGLNRLMEQVFPIQRTDPDHRVARRSVRLTLEESESSRQQLQLALENSEAELKSLRAQLEQTRLEYGSLRSELQLHDNTEQNKVVQSLKDLNRSIEDFSRAVAQHLVDDHIIPGLDSSQNLDEVTALQAINLSGLQAQFQVNQRTSSLISASSGTGMPIEDFFDLALRSNICRRLYQDIFLPFHPMIGSTSNATFMSSLYEGIRHHAPQSVAAKWRANSFVVLTEERGPEARREAIKSQSRGIMMHNITNIIDGFFGQEKAVTLNEQHFERIEQVVNCAWEWNDALKGDIVTLGDFQPTFYEPGQPFRSNLMSEFEGRSGGPPAAIAMCTISLGLSLSHAKGQVEPSDAMVVCKANVVTENFYDRQ